jgi:hypothetical protein
VPFVTDRRAACLALFLSCAALSIAACAGSDVPEALSDQEFWTLVETLSEPPGSFALSENFVSNEPRLAENARRLRAAGGIYIGVGPEQNFTYIARIRPAMAFIIDIRRENLNLHLLYKALFEASIDRADFVSRLFSRPRPAGLHSTATVEAIFSQYESVPPSADLLTKTAALVRDRLLTVRKLPLTEPDLAWIDRALKAFHDDGPRIQFWGARSVDTETVRPSYRELMTSLDWSGQTRSFLASEGAFRFVQKLHSRNLIVPVVGDFAGPTAIRRVGDYVRTHGDVVQTFYGSNVGVYLNNQQTRAFCGNLASLPATRRAWFIERDAVKTLTQKLESCPAVVVAQ